MSTPGFFLLGGTLGDATPDSPLAASAKALLEKATPTTPTPADPRPPRQSITEHTVTIDGVAHRYRATAGRQTLKDRGEGKPRAEMFHVAYELIDAPERRPLTFVFNGGPGSSSVWLHMGALGPRRVQLTEEGYPPRDPAVIDNDHSWLDLTDLVFIDPISTGLSRAADGQDAKTFHTLEEDVKSVAEFIRLFLSKRQRWQSPIYLAGESYGSTRAAALAHHLQTQHGIYPAGIALISPALDFQPLEFHHGNDIAFVLNLPTYAAAAWYHKRLEPALTAMSVRSLLDQVEEFARTHYSAALAAGGDLPAPRKTELAQSLARFTGIDHRLWLAKHLRLREEFFPELLRLEGRIIGRLDTRFSAANLQRKETDLNADPSYAAIAGAFTSGLHTHLLGSLKYESELKYEILYLDLEHWNFGSPNRYVTTAPDLLKAMTDDPRLRVLTCAGIFDAATPHFATQHSMSHIGLDPSVRGRITTAFYESGHMMYIRLADLRKLKADARGLYAIVAE